MAKRHTAVPRSEGASMRLRLKPRDNRLFDWFSTAGPNIVDAVDLLREFVAAPEDQRSDLAKRMHDAEHAGDDATHAIMEPADRSFITPSDREESKRPAAAPL